MSLRIWIIAAVLLAGCQAALVEHPVTQTAGGTDADSQLEFWSELETQRVTSNDDAFHGLLLYLDGNDPAPDYAHRVTALKSRGLLLPGFDRAANESVGRGVLAVAIAKVLKIKGGVMMRLTGGNVDRYALRELIYRKVYPAGSENQTFSGAEYVGIIGKIDDYQHGDPANVPATVLPSEMQAAAKQQ
jgi:hypothetical protein